MPWLILAMMWRSTIRLPQHPERNIQKTDWLTSVGNCHRYRYRSGGGQHVRSGRCFKELRLWIPLHYFWQFSGAYPRRIFHTCCRFCLYGPFHAPDWRGMPTKIIPMPVILVWARTLSLLPSFVPSFRFGGLVKLFSRIHVPLYARVGWCARCGTIPARECYL
jgi:hypothetical protein